MIPQTMLGEGCSLGPMSKTDEPAAQFPYNQVATRCQYFPGQNTQQEFSQPPRVIRLESDPKATRLQVATVDETPLFGPKLVAANKPA